MISSSGPDLNSLLFGIDRVEKARLTGNGNLGIATLDPKSRLQVENGDVYLSSIGTGVVMKSANGSCWRMTVDNSGNPVFTSIPCP
jgi:hypothetical protein